MFIALAQDSGSVSSTHTAWPMTPAPGYLTPPSDLCRNLHRHDTHKLNASTHMHTYKNK